MEPMRRPFPTLAVALLAVACGGPPPSEIPASDPPAGTARDPAPTPPFREAAAEVGLDFVHWNGMTGEHYYCEHMGGGGALFDYDGDGDLDVYLTQGHLLGPGKELGDAIFPPRHPLPATDRLYRNDLAVHPDGRRELRFTDVTAESGIVGDRYSMGAAVGDYDNDGWPDLYVSTWASPNQLFRNRGDGTFVEVTEEAGVGETRWTVSATFVDYDRDGWLDLFAGNNLDYTFSLHKECADELGQPGYCGPIAFTPIPDTLYRNLGRDAAGRVRFEDVSVASGIRTAAGPGLGVVASDFDADGWLDLYVANDGYPNHLWLNQRDGTFRNDAMLAGAAMNAEGHAEAGMGVSAADVDNDGDEDLFVAHLTSETNTLYTNDQAGIFADRTTELGLGAPSLAATGFGTGFFDYDNDGDFDLVVVNGAVKAIREQMLAGDPYPMHQRNQLYHNDGGRFRDVTAEAGAAFEPSEVSRGAAFGDLDNDGDTDVVVMNNAAPVRLLLNQVGQDRPWIGLRLVGESGRDMLGAWVEVLRPGQPTLGRRVRSDGSYAASHDPRVLVGLGDGAPAAVAVEVTWPDGRRERWPEVVTGVYTTLAQGTGTAVEEGS